MLRDIHANGPLSLQSDVARMFTVEVSQLASLGLITSILNDAPTRQWRLTAAGLHTHFTGEVYV